MGAVLVKEQDNVQRPVYFFSYLLKRSESRYTTIEKLVYGLVLMAQRLRPYFLAHPITILTNNTMGKALTNVEVAGRLIKWATELGEYNITYQPRTAIKAQALADFLTELAVRLNFRATNNETEYEALLAGLQAARHVGAARVIIYSDSQLVTQQVTGNFEINCDKLQLYREAYEKMKEEFKEVTVSKIPRAENSRADKLAKMASSLTTRVLDRSIAQTFLITQIDLQNNQNEIIDWRAPMISYLQQSALPTDLKQSRLIRKKAYAYTMVGDQLYKRVFSRPLLKCISVEEADQVLREMHLGCYGSHAGGRTLACKWGMDIVDPFPMTSGQKRFLLVVVDYFSKWAKAEALARITEGAVIQFLWRNILYRFDIPHKLVSDNGRQFQDRKIQIEVINREIVRGLKVKLDHVGGDWVEELQSVLWTYRTTPRESTSLTPFHLVYGSEAVMPVEVGVPSIRRMLYDEENAERRLAELDLIIEIREQTAA
ncbi:uncharacterized protein LOC121994834 [Zingiber officinale]|uniref:uncharacterized protein LOC121994834 n=1 Tax=Zingiber officinale TaxID=94328 RepID=UPI001C4B685A|nr:uncharacterized protein LOC121994834 [Zingiber officinale]